VQQFVVILGVFLFALTGNGWPVLIVFIGIKTYLDLILKDFSFDLLKKMEEEMKERQDRKEREEREGNPG
jgi:hypothetical protein